MLWALEASEKFNLGNEMGQQQATRNRHGWLSVAGTLRCTTSTMRDARFRLCRRPSDRDGPRLLSDASSKKIHRQMITLLVDMPS
jgi:hypothetical protein